MALSFENLRIWEMSRSLVKQVYKALRYFPNEERYALCDQIRRSAVSVPSNIAEGTGRVSKKEKIHFCEIAYGSLMELLCQLILSSDLGFLSDEHLKSLRTDIEQLAYRLSAYRSALLNSEG